MPVEGAFGVGVGGGVGVAAEDAAADAQDHGAVAGDEGGEGGLGRFVAAAGDEACQELGVGELAGRPEVEGGVQLGGGRGLGMPSPPLVS